MNTWVVAVVSNSFLPIKDSEGVAEKTSAVKLDDGLLNSCTSPRNKTEVGITAGLLPGLTTVHEVHTGEYATRSNTFGDKDKALGGFSDFGTELAKCENNVGTINRINDDNRHGGSRDDHTKNCFQWSSKRWIQQISHLWRKVWFPALYLWIWWQLLSLR
jgi:hypothetical protein